MHRVWDNEMRVIVLRPLVQGFMCAQGGWFATINPTTFNILLGVRC